MSQVPVFDSVTVGPQATADIQEDRVIALFQKMKDAFEPDVSSVVQWMYTTIEVEIHTCNADSDPIAQTLKLFN